MAVEFLGQSFDLPDKKINQRRLLRLAGLAQGGADSDNMSAMAELDALLKQCIRPEDAKRFDDLCDDEGVDTAELFEFAARVIGALAERPTVRPSVSSDGPTSTPQSSELRLVELASERWSGRPDLVLAATRTA